MNRKLRTSPLLTLPLLASAVAVAQTSPDPPKTWQYSGILETAYTANLNHPASGINDLYNFNINSDDFTFTNANFDLQYTRTHFGFHLDTGFGKMARLTIAPDPWHGPNEYVGQLYATYKPFIQSGLQFDFGKFYSSVGAESAFVTSDFNYSRSLLFSIGEPFHHFGLRATVPIGTSWTTGIQVVNGWNNVSDNNSAKTVAFTAAYSKPRWSWSHLYMTGREATDPAVGSRHLYNSILTFSPTAVMKGYAEALYTSERQSQSTVARWGGVAVAAQIAPFKQWSFSPRWEFYNDAAGATSGRVQHLQELTATVEYRPVKYVIFRAEYRIDHSNRAFFHDGTQHNQQTVALAVIFSPSGSH